MGCRCWGRDLRETARIGGATQDACRGVVLEKWPGGTEALKVGEEWPGPVKCVYTVRRIYGICGGLEAEPGCGG